MSRLPKTMWGEVEPAIQRVFEAFWKARGNVPNLFRVLAHRPPLFRSFTTHFNEVMGPGTVDVRLKELVAVRVSQMNDCRYCLASHTVLAKKYGATDDDLAALGDLPKSRLAESEKEAIRFAEKVTREHRAVSASDVERLRAHFDAPQVVELLSVIGIFNYLNRFAEALDLEPTKPGEGGPETSEGGSHGE